jgi:DNA-binding transcriptional ArsR family regulator
MPPVEDDVREIPAPMQREAELAVFAALADPTRRQLLELLVEVGRASATVLAGHVPVSRQMVVKHLRLLEAAGLVGGARAGREVLYVAQTGPLDASARWLTELSQTCHRRQDGDHVSASGA